MWLGEVATSLVMNEFLLDLYYSQMYSVVNNITYNYVVCDALSFLLDMLFLVQLHAFVHMF